MRFKTAKSNHGPYINLELVRSWLRECSRLHGSRCPDIRSREQRANYRDTPLLLIDVDSMCLVYGSTSWRYLTLSYCWGVVDEWRLRLIKSNCQSLMKPGVLKRLDSSIPGTLIDAIHLTREIGERYLWIDSLCLVQDDYKDLAKSTDNMGHIYNQSMLTVVARSGVDAYSGLPGVKMVARKSLTKQF